MLNAKETIRPLDGGGVTCTVSVSVSLIGIDSFIRILLRNSSTFLLQIHKDLIQQITCTTPGPFS